MEHTYSFKNWARDISLWTMVTELPAEKQAVAVVLQLKGSARDMVADTPAEILQRGGRLVVDGDERHFHPVPYIIALLARRYEPLAEELAIKSTFDFMNFQRKTNEKTDELLARFDTLRQRARDIGG
eukprot:6278566-Prorocentrum_lima.AAC.1